MINNYIKIALRHLTRNTIYSFINLSGLSVGIASFILIMLWVSSELSYDRFHVNYERIQQVHINQRFADGIGTQQPVPFLLKDAIKSQSAGIASAVITNWGEGNTLATGDKIINKYGLSATQEFFSVFDFSFVAGDRATAIQDPNSIVITESLGRALFGARNPLGELIKIDNERELKVTGVIADVPQESTLQFDYVLPFAFYESTQNWVKYAKDNWKGNSFRLYARLTSGAVLDRVNVSVKDLVRKNNPEGQTCEVFLFPYADLHLYSKFENGKPSGGLIDYVRLFTAIAVLILVIACINFMNLATARAEARAREVGIRKTIGSRRTQLIGQFLGESIFIVAIAFIFAVGIAELALPFYAQLVGKSLFIDYRHPGLYLLAIALVFITGALAGSYPAFYLSSFRAAQVLKGKYAAGKGSITPRRALVVVQFASSIFLLVGTIVIYQQINFAKERETGYKRDNLMLIWTNSDVERNFEPIRRELVAGGAVTAICKSNSPVTKVFSSANVEWPGMPTDTRVSFTSITTEYDYTATLGIRMRAGRDFSRDFKSDSSAVVVNEAAIAVMGLTNPIGTKLRMWNAEWTIIGVMEDVVMDNPYQPVAPLIMTFNPSWSSTISVRLNETTDLAEALASVERVFKKYSPAYPFSFRFADNEFNQKFSAIHLTSRLTGLFASLAIVISCLGLFGLAAFTAEQRAKEVGIRKVMGASRTNLVLLMSRDFSVLVVFSFVIAAPISWWALNRFLSQYEYRVGIEWWLLPAVGSFALILSLIIVSTQAWRTASANPVKSLRSE